MCDHHFWYNLENVTGSLIGKKELVFLLLYLHSHVSKDINGKQITFHVKISINRVNAYAENNVIWVGRKLRYVQKVFVLKVFVQKVFVQKVFLVNIFV